MGYGPAAEVGGRCGGRPAGHVPIIVVVPGGAAAMLDGILVRLPSGLLGAPLGAGAV